MHILLITDLWFSVVLSFALSNTHGLKNRDFEKNNGRGYIVSLG